MFINPELPVLETGTCERTVLVHPPSIALVKPCGGILTVYGFDEKKFSIKTCDRCDVVDVPEPSPVEA